MINAQEAAARKQRIKDTAYALFCEQGVDQVTFLKIARTSGISQASVYRYYKTKSDLLVAMHEYIWQELFRLVTDLLSEQKDFPALSGEAQLRMLLSAFSNTYLERREFLEFSLDCKLYWIRHDYQVSEEVYQQITGPTRALFEASLRKGLADGSLKMSVDLEDGLQLLWGILLGFME